MNRKCAFCMINTLGISYYYNLYYVSISIFKMYVLYIGHSVDRSS